MNFDVSRTGKNIYEKKDKRSWLHLPDYSEDNSTFFLDASDMVYYKKESADRKTEEEIRDIFSNAL